MQASSWQGCCLAPEPSGEGGFRILQPLPFLQAGGQGSQLLTEPETLPHPRQAVFLSTFKLLSFSPIFLAENLSGFRLSPNRSRPGVCLTLGPGTLPLGGEGSEWRGLLPRGLLRKQSRTPPFNTAVKHPFPQNRPSPRGEGSQRPGKTFAPKGTACAKGRRPLSPDATCCQAGRLRAANARGGDSLSMRHAIIPHA